MCVIKEDRNRLPPPMARSSSDSCMLRQWSNRPRLPNNTYQQTQGISIKPGILKRLVPVEKLKCQFKNLKARGQG